MIDLEQARDLLRRAVETQGRDFIYNHPDANERCHYVPNPELPEPKNLTGCLIGVALDLAGETRHHISFDLDWTVFDLGVNFPGMMTQEARDYFSAAQREQDQGSTWGEAYDFAESTIEMSSS